MAAFAYRAFQGFLRQSAPHHHVRDPYLRRQAQILAAMSLVTIFFFIPISFITPVLTGTLSLGSLLLRLVGVAGGAIVYTLARRGYAKQGGALFILLTWGVLYGIGLVGSSGDNLIGVLRTFDLLVLVTLFARVVMSTQTTLIIFVLMLISLLFVPVLRPTVTYPLINASLLFNFSVGGMILVVITLYEYGERALHGEVERKQRELDTLMGNSPDYIVRVDLEYRYRYANLPVQRSFNRSLDEIVGKLVMELPPNPPPALVANRIAWLEGVQAAVETGETVRRQLRAERNEVKSIWFDLMFVPERDKRGVIRTVLVVGRDITDQKRVEAELQRERAFIKKITDTTTLMIYVYHRKVDGVGRMIFANPAFETFFGLPPGDWHTLNTPQFYDALHPDDVTVWNDHLRHVIEAPDEPATSIDIRLRRADGEYRWLRYWLTVFDPLPNRDDGQLLGIVADVTDEKRIQAAMVESELARAELQAAQEIETTKTQMMIRVADQFRNPLAAVLTATDLLELYNARMTDQGRLERFAQIRDQVAQLTKLLDDMNLVLRSGTHLSYFSHPNDRFDLSALAQQLLEVNANKFGSVHTVHFESSGDTSAVDGSPEVIRTILTPLLHNAFLYTPPDGTITLEIAVHDRIMLCVRDTGIGLLPADGARIFEPFYRGGNIDERPGLGLGLSIVRDTVIAHHGVIEVSGEAGSGTAFTVWLPRITHLAVTQTISAMPVMSPVSADDHLIGNPGSLE